MAFGRPSNEEGAREPSGKAQRLAEQELAQAQGVQAVNEQFDLDKLLDDHNSSIAGIQGEIDEETNVRHPRNLASIDKNDANAPDQRLVDINAENRRSKNLLDSLQRQIALENQSYQGEQDACKAHYSGNNGSGVKTESLLVQEQKQLNQAADNHDTTTAQIENQKDGEELVRHPRADASIAKNDANTPDQKKVDLANEMRLFKNNLASFARALGLENVQYQLTISGIKGNFSAQINGGGGQSPPAPATAPSAAPSAQPTSQP